MEINQIYSICKENYEKLEHIDLELTSSDIYQIKDSQSINTIIQELSNTHYLGEPLTNFIQIFKELDGKKIGNKESVVKFLNSKEQLLLIMDYIIKTYELANLYDEDKIGLDVKFPIPPNFSDFRKNIDDLDFILTKCPFWQHNNERLQFKCVHNGSVLLTFIIVGAGTLIGSALLNNIATFIDQCFIVKSHHLIVEKQKQDIEMSKIEQKEKETIIKSLDLLYKAQVDIVIERLEDLLKYKLEDGDEQGRVEQSIEKVNKLIDQGMQIYTTLGTPEETKLLFEPLKMKYLPIEDSLKSIEKIIDESSEDNSNK